MTKRLVGNASSPPVTSGKHRRSAFWFLNCRPNTSLPGRRYSGSRRILVRPATWLFGVVDRLHLHWLEAGRNREPPRPPHVCRIRPVFCTRGAWDCPGRRILCQAAAFWPANALRFNQDAGSAGVAHGRRAVGRDSRGHLAHRRARILCLTSVLTAPMDFSARRAANR
jgi:hypothetical protein